MEDCRKQTVNDTQKGWIAVYTAGTYSRYGHIGIVYDGGNTTSFQILEQNWNGWANKNLAYDGIIIMV